MVISERLLRETGKEYALRMLTENLITMELEPGSCISPNDLAAELGISRGPVREALNELSKIGIIEVYPQSGCKVSLIDYHIINQARFLRTTLECAVIGEVCQIITDKDVTRLEENMTLMEFYYANKMHDKLYEQDNLFHHLLFEIANKEEVYVLMKNFNIHSDRLRTFTISKLDNSIVIEDHKKLLEAIRERDREKAMNMMRIHLTRYTSEKEILQKSHPEYFKQDT